MLAAQDIYTHILVSVLKAFSNLGGETCVSGNHKSNFRVHNDRVDTLATAFQNAGLGDFDEGLLCILPALFTRRLLPEISVDSLEVRQQMQNFVQERNHSAIFTMSEWLCCLDDYGNVERSLIEYGFLCLRSLMNRDVEMRELAIERIMATLTSTYDRHSLTLNSPYLSHISSVPSFEWWENFRGEMHCMAACLSWYQLEFNPDERTMKSFGKMQRQLGLMSAMNGPYYNLAAATEYHSAFLCLWFGSNDWFAHQGILDWLVGHDYKNILEWLVIRVINEAAFRFSVEEIVGMMKYATTKQYIEVIRMLSHHIEKEHVRDELISTLAAQGDVQTLEMLFESWKDNTLMKAREIALLSAAEKKQRPVIEMNLQRGVDVDACGEDGETALLRVAGQGDIDSVALLLARGADPEKRDLDGNTALIVAATRGHADIVELLVGHGANVNTIGNGGRTSLIAAVRIRSLSTLQFLLSQGADIHAQDDNHSTALDEAIYGGWKGTWAEGCALLESVGAIRKRTG